MNIFKKLVLTAGVAVAFASGASAETVLNNWYFNPTGVGGAAAGQIVHERLDVTGDAFIQLTPTGGTGFDFVEHAVFRSPYADNGAEVSSFGGTFGRYITATFEATGSGNFSGAFTFATGTINLYSNTADSFNSTAGYYGANQGTLIATFSVLAGGGGLVDGSGNPTGNGQITVNAKATTPGGMTPGYFFNPNGTDMTNQDMLSFAFTNANGSSFLTDRLVDEVACQFSGFAGPGCGAGTYANSPGQYFFVSNNGQFKLANVVPEPGSLALFGIALLGAGVVSRKRAANKA
jgi:hypothetical protein